MVPYGRTRYASCYRVFNIAATLLHTDNARANIRCSSSVLRPRSKVGGLPTFGLDAVFYSRRATLRAGVAEPTLAVGSDARLVGLSARNGHQARHAVPRLPWYSSPQRTALTQVVAAERVDSPPAFPAIVWRVPTWAASWACPGRPDGPGRYPSIISCFRRRWLGRLAASAVLPCRGAGEEPDVCGADHLF